MIVGDLDLLAVEADAEEIRDILAHVVEHYEVINGGHLTFFVGKDMSYVKKTVLPFVDKYAVRERINEPEKGHYY